MELSIFHPLLRRSYFLFTALMVLNNSIPPLVDVYQTNAYFNQRLTALPFTGYSSMH